MQRVNFDVHCASADIDIDDVQCVFDSAQHFIAETGFQFPDAKKVFFEPERSIYVVERSGGRCVVGQDLPEIEWIVDHLDEIREAGERVELSRQPAYDWRMDRFNRLALTDWYVTRHLEQQQLNITTSLTTQQFNQLMVFRQALRDLTEENHEFPQAPSFVQL